MKSWRWERGRSFRLTLARHCCVPRRTSDRSCSVWSAELVSGAPPAFSQVLRPASRPRHDGGHRQCPPERDRLRPRSELTKFSRWLETTQQFTVSAMPINWSVSSNKDGFNHYDEIFWCRFWVLKEQSMCSLWTVEDERRMRFTWLEATKQQPVTLIYSYIACEWHLSARFKRCIDYPFTVIKFYWSRSW